MKIAPPGAPEKHPKLEMAGQEIKEILERYDVAGVVILFTPGNVKPLLHLSPSFSCVGINDAHKLKITPPLLDPQNEAPYRQKITDTINMIGNLRIYSGKLSMTLAHAEQTTREHFKVQLPNKPNTPTQNGMP